MTERKFLETTVCSGVTATLDAGSLQSFIVNCRNKDKVIRDKEREINELKNTLRLTKALEIVDNLHISNMNMLFKEQPTINTIRYNSRIKTVNVDKDELMLLLDELDSARKQIQQLRITNKQLIEQKNDFDRKLLAAKINSNKSHVHVELEKDGSFSTYA